MCGDQTNNLKIRETSLRKQPSFFAPGPSGVSREGRPSRETPLGPGAKKDGFFRRLKGN